MKIKSVLISQPEPKTETSPYFELAVKLNLKIDFRPFSHVEGVSAGDVRRQKIDFKNYTALILTSRNAVDNYFRLAKEMRFTVPDDMKYFCQSEAVAYYLQKYVVYRKRKIYVGGKNFADLTKLIKKHKTEKFLLPTSETIKSEIPVLLGELGIEWDRAILYNNVRSDLSDLKDSLGKYNIIAIFNPAGIRSLFENFPDFKQGETSIATFGPSTLKEALAHGLEVAIPAPTPESQSMSKALEAYIKQVNSAK